MNEKECIQSSIEKWLEIREFIKENSPVRYFLTFWCRCGYCIYFEFCENCPLYAKSEALDIPFCYGSSKVESVALHVLQMADIGRWKNALRATNLLLAKMRRDLAKAKKDNLSK